MCSLVMSDKCVRTTRGNRFHAQVTENCIFRVLSFIMNYRMGTSSKFNLTVPNWTIGLIRKSPMRDYSSSFEFYQIIVIDTIVNNIILLYRNL